MAGSGSTARSRPRSATPSRDFRSRRASRATGRRRLGKLAADPGAARHFLFDGARAGGRRRDPVSGACRDPEGDRARTARARSMKARSPRTSWRPWRRAARFLAAGDLAAIAARPPSRSPPTIAASTWWRCRRTGRGSPPWCCSTSSSGSTSRRSIRPAPSASTSCSKRRASPLRCAMPTSPIPTSCAPRCRALLDKAFAGNARRPHRPLAPRAAARARRRPAAIPSISRWSTATAWRCR